MVHSKVLFYHIVGCSVQSDVVFLLDCSASIGSAVYDMQIGLIRDIIGHCDVAYDKVSASTLLTFVTV